MTDHHVGHLTTAGGNAMNDSQGAAAPSGGHILDRLFDVIESRRGADPAISHTARLLP